MADNNKYLDILRNTASSNWKPVNDARTALGIAKFMIGGEFTHARVSTEDWFALGRPPAQRDGNCYLIDLTDTRVIGLMWAKSIIDVMNLGCYAATDISDAINQINNDNLDNVISDREAVVAMSQIMIEGMNAFRKMHDSVQEEINRK